MRRSQLVVLPSFALALALALIAPVARAEGAAPIDTKDAPAAAPSAPPARFGLPFQLRAPIAKTLARIDAVASTHAGGATTASVLTLSLRVAPDVALVARVPYASLTPKTGAHDTAFGNPVAAVAFTPALRPTTRLSTFAGIAFPLAQGGGDAPVPSKTAAVGAGIYGRAALDNALFAVDYAVAIAGLGLAESLGACSVHAEITVLELVRVRAEKRQPDATRTNFTSGLAAGCYLRSPVQLVGEARYQRWLSTPDVVTRDAAKRDQATVGAGLRFDAKVGSVTLRPGVLVAVPVDDPMRKADYRQVMFDLPVVF